MWLDLETTSVGALLSAEVERWQPQAQVRDVRLSLHTPTELPDVDLDRGRMSQALGNLLSNAIHSVEPGGNVVLSAGLEAGESLSIAVTDDGAGIDPADLAHIFDRFYRAEQAQRRDVGGTGLGLAITRAIVEAHGGRVTASSEGLGLRRDRHDPAAADGGDSVSGRAQGLSIAACEIHCHVLLPRRYQ